VSTAHKIPNDRKRRDEQHADDRAMADAVHFVRLPQLGGRLVMLQGADSTLRLPRSRGEIWVGQALRREARYRHLTLSH